MYTFFHNVYLNLQFKKTKVIFTKTVGSNGTANFIDYQGISYVGGSNGHIIKVDTQGNVIWEYTTGQTQCYGMDVDVNGFIYVADYNNFAKKLNSDGTLNWQYNTGSVVNDIQVNNTDFSSYLTLNNNNCIKLDVNGNLIWTYTDTQYSKNCAVDSNGNIILVNIDGKIVKIDKDKNFLWTLAIVGGSYFTGVALDKFNNIYTCDQAGNINKVTADGVLIWKTITGGNTWAIDVDNIGNVYVAHGSADTLVKYNTNGKFMYRISYPNICYAVGVNARYDLIGTDFNGRLVKYKQI